MMTNTFNLSWKIKFMKVVKVDGAMHNPNGITKTTYEPYLVLKAVFFTFAYVM
jgi:hypothetical protein